MRHYLNTKLKGKQNVLGLNLYSVYFMFTVNRQTFKIKSRILRRKFREEEFEQINSPSNVFFSKDVSIVDQCIKDSTINGFLNIDLFKSLYTKRCTSITIWLEEQIRNQRDRIMDDFFYGSEFEHRGNSVNKLNKLELSHNIDKRVVLNYLNQFSMNQDNFDEYTLVHDWQFEELRQRFTNFLNNTEGIPAQHTSVILFIDELIKDI